MPLHDVDKRKDRAWAYLFLLLRDCNLVSLLADAPVESAHALLSRFRSYRHIGDGILRAWGGVIWRFRAYTALGLGSS